MMLVFLSGSTIKSPLVHTVTSWYMLHRRVPSLWSTASYLTKPLVNSCDAVIVPVRRPVLFYKCESSIYQAKQTPHTHTVNMAIWFLPTHVFFGHSTHIDYIYYPCVFTIPMWYYCNDTQFDITLNPDIYTIGGFPVPLWDPGAITLIQYPPGWHIKWYAPSYSSDTWMMCDAWTMTYLMYGVSEATADDIYAYPWRHFPSKKGKATKGPIRNQYSPIQVQRLRTAG